MGLRPTVGPTVHDDKKVAEVYARISQETFESAVQENIDEFDMEAAEAVADAVQQFESQGINLSNIIKRAPGAPSDEDPPVIVQCRAIQDLLDEAEDEDTQELDFGEGVMKITCRICDATVSAGLSEAAATLRAECQKDKEACNLAGHHGAVDSLISAALAVIRSPSALPPVLEALSVVLMDGENRERLGQRGVGALALVLRAHGPVAADATGTAETAETRAAKARVLCAALHACRAAMLVHEGNRRLFVTSISLLKMIARVMHAYPTDTPVFLAATGAMRTTTLSDDARARVSKGLEHAKAAVELKVLPMLLDAARGEMGRELAPLAELLATLSRLTVTDQICSQLANMDALSLAITELGNHMTDARVAKQACFFLAQISGNDACKGSIVRGSGHIAIVQAMLLHPNHAGLQTDAVSALGNMCLRMPANAEAIAECGGLGAIVQAFTQHLSAPRMQSKGCLAVRNIVGRNEELRQPLLDQGVEAPLRETLNANAEGYVHNLAKAALRDLHCSVSLAEEWKGEIGSAHCIEQGEVDGENHWDKFLDTPVAQEAIKRELEDLA